MNYKVISTGSIGNCTIINKLIAVDMGVTYKQIKPFIKDLRVVFLTHIHSDHFNEKTIRSLHKNRPSLRFACPQHLLIPLSTIVRTDLIDVIDIDHEYDYGKFRCKCNSTYHNVPNVAWHFFFPNGERALYATDLNTISHIKAIGYELYLVEANYSESEIRQRIKRKEESGQFAYENDVIRNHLSLEKCNLWLAHNAEDYSEIVYMHGHIDRGETNGNTAEEQ